MQLSQCIIGRPESIGAEERCDCCISHCAVQRRQLKLDVQCWSCYISAGFLSALDVWTSTLRGIGADVAEEEDQI